MNNSIHAIISSYYFHSYTVLIAKRIRIFVIVPLY